MSLESGDIVAGQYRLEDLLGRGGMGAVYRATHVGLAETVAVKVVQLPAGQSDAVEETFMKRFEREARVAFQLRHEHAVQVLDYGEHEGTPYLVMEYLEGKPLADELADGRPLPSLERTLAVGARLAEVLVAMHDQSLVHRDLKPENIILLDEEEGVRPVLVDFGLAYLADSETLGRVTQGGEVLGTPHYISPEQGKGAREIGPAADVYAFGCVLFEMVTGRVPFPEGSPSEMVGKHMYVPAPSVRETAGPEAPEIPERLDRMIGAMLSKEPEDRPAAEVVRDELEAFESGEDRRPRGRPERFLQERSERAVDEAPEGAADETAPQVDPELSPVVGIVGEVRDDWRVSLGNAGFECRAFDDVTEVSDVDVLFIHDADVESVEAYGGDAPVLAGCDSSDFEASTALLQTSAADVLPRPVQPADLVDKVAGLWRKARRRND